MPDLLLGIDVGTTHAKAVLTTAAGKISAQASAGYATSFPRPGWAEQNPVDWWRGVVTATQLVMKQATGRVAGIGVSGQGCAATLIDRTGAVVRPAIIWMDSRSEPQCERLRHCCLGDIIVKNGKAPAPYNADPVLMWLNENEPDAIARAETSLTTTAYINFRLTEQRIANFSDASLLFAFDLARRDWSAELIEEFNVPRRLYPPLAGCDEVIGTLTPAAAEELQLPAGIPVIAGGEDTSSAGLASGAVNPGLVFLSLGTAGTIYVPTDRQSVHPQLLSFLHVLPDQYLLGGSMVALGASLNWCRTLLGARMSFDRLNALAAASEPGAGRLIFLPYLSGELQPINDGYARGMLFGLTLSTERKHIVRAIMEGTAFAIAHNLSIIESLGLPVTEIRAVGGPTRSAVWCQIIADVIGRPVHVLAKSGGAPLGNAILAAKGAGLIDDPAAVALRAARIDRSYTPDLHLTDRYQSLFEIYRQLYPQVKEQSARLSRL